MNNDMLRSEFDMIKDKLDTLPVVKNWYGAKYLYLDSKTRVRYGICFPYFERVYSLQRKESIRWKTVAWNYAVVMNPQPIAEIIDYLFWEEADNTVAYKARF
jgi:hypothetical protein